MLLVQIMSALYVRLRDHALDNVLDDKVGHTSLGNLLSLTTPQQYGNEPPHVKYSQGAFDEEAERGRGGGGGEGDRSRRRRCGRRRGGRNVTQLDRGYGDRYGTASLSCRKWVKSIT